MSVIGVGLSEPGSTNRTSANSYARSVYATLSLSRLALHTFRVEKYIKNTQLSLLAIKHQVVCIIIITPVRHCSWQREAGLSHVSVSDQSYKRKQCDHRNERFRTSDICP